ncbi:hypothetical protein LV716_07710 [Flagellimonas sp. HMM57]|uniref:hypothetical protein n=1 Tax=unclassified Flagellimonas TaxID=2644544 RepID=UPI0013D753CB|nr:MULTISPECIES: hypothetical protein [unclassified Flagellimonas]UII77643.1 hypothetical protein LV716_07710 [Flagellimonas sp. HMM57]
MKSSFLSDLSKEKKLSKFLDAYYAKYLRHYNFKRIQDLEEQKAGVDVIFKNRKNNSRFFVDEKAQLDYLNDNLPTFAFELFYEINGKQKQGWLFDKHKKTQFYALITAIYTDAVAIFTSCCITLVNREKLIMYLNSLGLTQEHFEHLTTLSGNFHGKMQLEAIDSKHQGYLFFSRKNKVEKPVNLVLRLDFLIEIGVAKKLV